MRVAHVLGSVDDADAGPSYSVPALCRGLMTRGVEVSIHTVSGWRASGAGPQGVAVRRHPQDFAEVPVLGRMCLSTRLLTALRAEARAGQVIHSHGLWLMPNVYPAVAVRGTDARLILSPRGMLGTAALGFSATSKRLFWRALQERAARAADCLHVTAEAEYEEVRAFGLKGPVAVIANGVDVGEGASRRFPAARKTVLSLGRIHPKKGLPDLLHAWARSGAGDAGWRLRIVGPDQGGHAGELTSLGERLNLSGVSIEGPLHGEAKARAFREAHLFVLPSLNENFAMTVAEALAAGLPVIATRGAPWSGLETHGCGWWVKGGEAPLATALRAAMALPAESLAAMGARGCAWMTESFSWDARAREMLDVYRWLATGDERPAHVRLD